MIAFMGDNASNMDTFVTRVVSRAKEKDKQISINAEWAWLQCMPHTVHLAALKV
jgi:hypothetical protein